MDSAVTMRSVLPRPEVLLFDWDGTLVDSHPVLAKSMNVTLAEFGMAPWSYEDWKAWLGGSARDAFPEVFGDRWEEAKRIYYAAYAEAHLEQLALLPDADSLIAALAGEDVQLGVVTNKSPPFLKKEIARLGWQAHFVSCVGAGDASRDKPSPDPALLALEHLSHNGGKSVWFVGDNQVDVECGLAAGCTTVLVGDSASDREPDHRVCDLTDLKRLILSALNPT